ncbi:MAG: fructose-bisphosphatase class II family protein [Oscillospiraceae bacterium]|jgi:fructose-1,6-bisphosphatase II|nr:fructose-bisphosphatase class II family protein [Oscillospiraceae bacterium]
MAKIALPLEILARLTEFPAIEAAKTIGHGSGAYTDYKAVRSQRALFGEIPILGTIVSSEGKLDNSYRFVHGEIVGCGGEEVDIAVDPVDGTSLCAAGLDGAVSVVALGVRGSLMDAEETYMHKIAVGPKARGVVRFDVNPAGNIRNVAEAMGKKATEFTVAILDRARNQPIIKAAREVGAMVKLLPAGDLMPAIATCMPQSGIDMLYGSGGGPEGVIAAAALKCLGGDFIGRLDKALSEREIKRSLDYDVDESPMDLDDLAGGACAVSITAVTDAYFLKGVAYRGGRVYTETFLARNTSTYSINRSCRDLSRHNWQKYIEPDESVVRNRFLR